jgi:hypothetical protein
MIVITGTIEQFVAQIILALDLLEKMGIELLALFREP